MQIDSTVNPEATVNETIARFPQTVGVFNRFGIDTCCGGNITVADAARVQGIDPQDLTEALRRAVTS